MITNKLKENNPRTKLSYDIRSFLQVGFRFQYQLINLAWLSFDSFSFTFKIFTIFHDFSWLFLFFLDFFSIFHDTVMIYNTRNWSSDTTESQIEKKKTYFNAYFQYSQLKITGLNKMWSLKSLAMLKSESRTSPHQCNISDSKALFWCFVLIILRMASLINLFLLR